MAGIERDCIRAIGSARWHMIPAVRYKAVYHLLPMTPFERFVFIRDRGALDVDSEQKHVPQLS